MNRTKLKHNTEKRKSHTGEASQVSWAKQQKAQNG
jgi:hypothetical protein